MGELRDRLAAIKTGVKEKLSIYSAHDYTLIPLLIGLGIMPGKYLYLSCLIIFIMFDYNLSYLSCYYTHFL